MSTTEIVRPVQGLYTVAPKHEYPMLHQSTAAVMISKSPMHAWHKAFHAEPEYTDATDTGTLAHALLLGGKDIVVCEFDDWRKKEAREARDAARAAGKHPVLLHKLEEAQALTSKIAVGLGVRGIELFGANEVTAVWQSPTGVWCQGRIDHFILKTATIYDFKFCQSASPDYISKAMVTYGCDIQCAAYTQAIETIYPQLAGRVKFIFIYIEPEPPHAITLVRPSGVMRSLGESKWGRAVEMWREYLETYGTKEPWPQYANGVLDIDPPAWAMSQEVIGYEIREGGNL